MGLALSRFYVAITNAAASPERPVGIAEGLPPVIHSSHRSLLVHQSLRHPVKGANQLRVHCECYAEFSSAWVAHHTEDDPSAQCACSNAGVLQRPAGTR